MYIQPQCSAGVKPDCVLVEGMKSSLTPERVLCICWSPEIKVCFFFFQQDEHKAYLHLHSESWLIQAVECLLVSSVLRCSVTPQLLWGRRGEEGIDAISPDEYWKQVAVNYSGLRNWARWK